MKYDLLDHFVACFEILDQLKGKQTGIFRCLDLVQPWSFQVQDLGPFQSLNSEALDLEQVVGFPGSAGAFPAAAFPAAGAFPAAEM